MAEKKIYGLTKFIFRGDTIENWEKTNPILEFKELVLILNQSNQTTGFKIGDGVTDFKNLETKTFSGTVDLSNYYNKSETDALVKDNIKLWQPNTEYKVGDVVYGAINLIVNGEDVPHNYLFKCIEEHTSSSGSAFDFPYMADGDYWNSYPIESRSSFDDLGRRITTTYATKEELAEAIGQALEGDY